MSHESEATFWNTPLTRRTLLGGLGAGVVAALAGCEGDKPAPDCDNLPQTAEHKEVGDRSDLTNYNWHIPGVEKLPNGHLRVSPIEGDVPMNMYGARLDLQGDFAVGSDFTLSRGAEFTMHLKSGVALSYEGGFVQSPASLRIIINEHGGSVDLFRSETEKQVSREFSLNQDGRNKQIFITRQGDKVSAYIGDQQILTPTDDMFTSGHVWFGLASEQGTTDMKELTARGHAEVFDTSTIEFPACATGLAAHTARKLNGRKPFAIGTATKLPAIVSDQKYGALLTGEFDSFTTENAGKMRFLQPSEGHFTFGELDSIIDFAARHKKEVWLHTLVWDKELPKWVETMSPDRARDIMMRHITTVAEHTRGKIKGIDVINEPLKNYDGTLRDSIWTRGMGEEYIAIAFQTAAQADPDAELWLNEYGWDKNNQADEARFQKLFAIVKNLIARGVKIHGIGLQSHVLQIPRDSAHIPTLSKRIDAFANLDVKVRISEIDVTPDAGRKKQAEQFSNMFELALSHPNVTGYTTWGIGGPYVSTASADKSTLTTRTLWDENLEPIQAYADLQNQLRG